MRSTPPGRMDRRTGVVLSRTSSRTRRSAASRDLLAQVEAVGVVVGHQLAVVGVGALEQTGADPDRPVDEGDLLGADGHPHLGHPSPRGSSPSRGRSPRGQPLELGQGPGRHEDVTATVRAAQALGARQVAQGQPVGVGGHQADRPALLGEQHTGEQRSRVVGRGRPHHLAQSLGQHRRRQHHRRLLAPRPRPGTRPPGRPAARSASGPPRSRPSPPPPSTVTAPGSSDRTMSTASRAGTTHSPSSRPMTSRSTRMVRSRSVPVTTRRFPAHRSSSPESTGEDDRAAADRPAGGREGLDERVAFGAELHRPPTCRRGPHVWSHMKRGNSFSRGSRGWGLWMERSHPWWEAVRSSTGREGVGGRRGTGDGRLGPGCGRSWVVSPG